MCGIQNDQAAAYGSILSLVSGLDFINRGNYHNFRFFAHSERKNEIFHPLTLIPECLSKRNSLCKSSFDSRITYVDYQISQFDIDLTNPANLQ